MKLFALKPKPKLGTIFDRTKGVPLNELDLTQFALEELQKRLRKFEDSHNANDAEMREIHIQLNQHGIKLQRLRERTGRYA